GCRLRMRPFAGEIARQFSQTDDDDYSNKNENREHNKSERVEGAECGFHVSSPQCSVKVCWSQDHFKNACAVKPFASPIRTDGCFLSAHELGQHSLIVRNRASMRPA